MHDWCFPIFNICHALGISKERPLNLILSDLYSNLSNRQNCQSVKACFNKGRLPKNENFHVLAKIVRNKDLNSFLTGLNKLMKKKVTLIFMETIQYYLTQLP